MKTLRSIVVAAVLATTCSMVPAQFVKGNEAVIAEPTGTKTVETPPLPPASVLAKPCPAETAGCAGGGWNMVETAEGLMECTELYARPGTCRPSRYGNEKRSRLWIVKSKGRWLQCQYPDLSSRCVTTKALPFDAVQ